MATDEARTERILKLRRRVDEFNSKVAVQEHLYRQFINQLATFGLTPETLPIEIQRLTEVVESIGMELDRQLDDIEEKLQ